MDTATRYTGQNDRLVLLVIPIVVCGALLLALFSLETYVGFCVIAAALGILLVTGRRFEFVMYVLFTLVAWFPEFSQTDWEVWSAEDFRSLYNYRPIPWLTASVFDYLIALIVCVWFVRVVFPNPRRLVQLPLGRAMLAFFGFSLFSLVLGLYRGHEAYYALREFRVSAYFVLFYFMLMTVMDPDTVVRKSGWIVIASAFIVGAYGITRYALGIGQEYYGQHLVYYDLGDSSKAAALETDPAKRAADYKDITEYVLHNGPYIILYQPLDLFGVRANVKGFAWSAIGWTDFAPMTK